MLTFSFGVKNQTFLTPTKTRSSESYTVTAACTADGILWDMIRLVQQRGKIIVLQPETKMFPGNGAFRKRQNRGTTPTVKKYIVFQDNQVGPRPFPFRHTQSFKMKPHCIRHRRRCRLVLGRLCPSHSGAPVRSSQPGVQKVPPLH